MRAIRVERFGFFVLFFEVSLLGVIKTLAMTPDFFFRFGTLYFAHARHPLHSLRSAHLWCWIFPNVSVTCDPLSRLSVSDLLL